ncbi:hypothetical protein HOLleu_03822 [Holothuria leucospilota]|uniref:Uncharacterized protein n=1 Tax=Holothuria leucospilota TaxID=206669 RepID=A0A9Q1CTI0_HOLLE|nr:hypothetical protein HOLleu_03822 [Holothuria leucospilota]
MVLLESGEYQLLMVAKHFGIIYFAICLSPRYPGTLSIESENILAYTMALSDFEDELTSLMEGENQDSPAKGLPNQELMTGTQMTQAILAMKNQIEILSNKVLDDPLTGQEPVAKRLQLTEAE